MGRRKKTDEKITVKKSRVNETNEAVERKTFTDWTSKVWFQDEDDGTIKVGESMAMIMKGDCDLLEVREIHYGEPSNTWRIVITTDDRIHLLKSAKQRI